MEDKIAESNPIESTDPQQKSPAVPESASGELQSQTEGSQQSAKLGTTKSSRKPPTSERKSRANRENAKASTGPRTVRGKQNSRRNSWKHGLYAKDSIIRPETKEEVNRLVRELRSQYRPETPSQQIAFREISFCAWQCELAARLDMRATNALLFPADEKESALDPDARPTMDAWYGAGVRELNAGISFLQKLMIAVEDRGIVPEQWKEDLRRGFGEEFVESVTAQKSPIDLETLKTAVSLIYKEKTYNLGTSTAALLPAPEVILDPTQITQNMLNLIKERILHLQELREMSKKSLASIRADARDSPPRHFEAASRNFHRAIKRYLFLLEEGL